MAKTEQAEKGCGEEPTVWKSQKCQAGNQQCPAALVGVIIGRQKGNKQHVFEERTRRRENANDGRGKK